MQDLRKIRTLLSTVRIFTPYTDGCEQYDSQSQSCENVAHHAQLYIRTTSFSPHESTHSHKFASKMQNSHHPII